MKKFIGKHYIIISLLIISAVMYLVFGVLGVDAPDAEPGAFILYILGAWFLGRCLGHLCLFLKGLREDYS